MKYTDIDEAVKRLEECGRLEGCETGGMWISIAELWTSYQDYISDELREVLEKEIIREAERTADLTNPKEWRLLFKAKQEHQSIFDKKEEGPWRPMTTGEVLQEGDAWSEIGMGYIPIKPDMIGKTVDAEYLFEEFGGSYFTKRSL